MPPACRDRLSYSQGWFSLVYDNVVAQWRLLNRGTGQSGLLEPIGEWALHDSLHGAFAFCSSTNTSIWCEDKLTDVIEEQAGDYFVYDALLDKVVPLQDYKSVHEPRCVEVLGMGSSKPHDMLVYMLQHRVDGASCFWSLQRLYRSTIPANSVTASGWYQNWWRHWHKDAALLTIPRSHLRKSVALQHQKPAQDLEDAAFRIFQEASVSSAALIAILTRCSRPGKGDNGNAKDEVTRLHWNSFFRGLMLKAMPHDFVITLFHEPHGCLWAAPLHGSGLVEIHVGNGRADSRPLNYVPGKEFSSAWRKRPWVSHMVDVVELLQFLSLKGKATRVVFLQCVHRCAQLVDCLAEMLPTEAKDTAGLVSVADMMVDEKQARRDRRARLGKLAWEVSRHVPEDIRLRMLQYFVAMRGHFHAHHQYMSIALDASRISLRNTLVGFVATPDNIGCWLPPQANPVF